MLPRVQPRIGILVVAYNAAGTLARVSIASRPTSAAHLGHPGERRPQRRCDVRLVGLGYQQFDQSLLLKVVRNPRNLGYGGNQKVGYRWAIEQGLDIIVMVHGDGQYAPEKLPDMVAPLERGEADAVFGSRLIEKGGSPPGGMPSTSTWATGC